MTKALIRLFKVPRRFDGHSRAAAKWNRRDALLAAACGEWRNPPYTWTVIGGAIPQGFTLSATGLLSGTATSPFVNNFYVKVSDSGGKSITSSGYYSLGIH